MTAQFARAPHRGRPATPAGAAPNAALLIDFDNVTMGIRSDLSKELKHLLNSDIIKGKVAVQRAYADWRRYPQYIVPLSEASIDLIFAPAYGSSKKNATDIRMAIDALELVFIRPEIGTYILLTGDSDFSALVLKLKEYGKYVIGVGMKESRSDILVQNCDEYYSYSGLTGLTKAGEGAPPSEDPWALVERAVRKMDKRNDVMRSDRLKQVMLELDPNFDEKGLGYGKFNKFISEAAKRDRIRLQKQDNGQYEVAPVGGGSPSPSRRSGSASGGKRDGGGRSRRRGGTGRGRSESQSGERELTPAYDLLRRAVKDLLEKGGDAARDSDIKRRMLEFEPDWDERDLGLSKFSQFLRKAHDAEVIILRKGDNGIYEALLPEPSDRETGPSAGDSPKTDAAGDTSRRAGRAKRGVGAFRSRRSAKRADDGGPPILEGQTISTTDGTPSGDGAAFAERLNLPTSAGALVRYVVNSYKGVGKKTAEALIDAFGAENVFATLERDVDRVREVLGDGRRTSALLDAWQADRERRRERATEAGDADDAPGSVSGERASAGSPRSGERSRPAAQESDAPADDVNADHATSQTDVSTDTATAGTASTRAAPAGGRAEQPDEPEGESGEDAVDKPRRRRTRLGGRGSSRDRHKTPAGGR